MPEDEEEPSEEHDTVLFALPDAISMEIANG